MVQPELTPVEIVGKPNKVWLRGHRSRKPIGFRQWVVHINSSDERSVIYSCENEKLLLGFCAYETYEWEMEYYCYQLDLSHFLVIV